MGKKSTNTLIKSTIFLSSISYMGANKEDFYNKNFVSDIYTLITKNLNPFSLDRKLSNQNMPWKECVPPTMLDKIFGTK